MSPTRLAAERNRAECAAMPQRMAPRRCRAPALRSRTARRVESAPCRTDEQHGGRNGRDRQRRFDNCRDNHASLPDRCAYPAVPRVCRAQRAPRASQGRGSKASLWKGCSDRAAPARRRQSTAACRQTAAALLLQRRDCVCAVPHECDQNGLDRPAPARWPASPPPLRAPSRVPASVITSPTRSPARSASDPVSTCRNGRTDSRHAAQLQPERASLREAHETARRSVSAHGSRRSAARAGSRIRRRSALSARAFQCRGVSSGAAVDRFHARLLPLVRPQTVRSDRRGSRPRQSKRQWLSQWASSDPWTSMPSSPNALGG